MELATLVEEDSVCAVAIGYQYRLEGASLCVCVCVEGNVG